MDLSSTSAQTATLEYSQRPYRPCVGIMLVNPQGLVFAGRRLDNRAEAWQMPQGGIDPGETPAIAALREMEEEIGTNKAEIIAEHPDWLDYDIPLPLADQLWQGRFRGQTQKWMALRYLGSDSDINIATAEPEFCDWRWIAADRLPALAVPFKRKVYEQVLETFLPLI